MSVFSTTNNSGYLRFDCKYPSRQQKLKVCEALHLLVDVRGFQVNMLIVLVQEYRVDTKK